MRYAVVVSRTDTGYSAYPPDLPGVGVAGRSLEEVLALIEEAIAFHLEGLRLHDEPVPEPTSETYIVEVA
ncbi:MAG TPA: type II toxin-antitoxin system HicB family antitoxin [Nitrolancea sp.]|nr:type II toxin-antitoxin system HicB family antitoxin [Nitrolancea sp.]